VLVLVLLQVLEMTQVDLNLAVRVVQHARDSLPPAPSSAAGWGRAPGMHLPGQWELQERMRSALQVSCGPGLVLGMSCTW
jgi:hypothetical protein